MSEQLLLELTPGGLLALIAVILIDLTLAGDNALAIARAVQNLPVRQQHLAKWCGLLFATLLRLAMALIIGTLFHLPGLKLLGGLLLLWMGWQSWRDLQQSSNTSPVHSAPKLGEVMLQIIVADLAMSLDNVLGVAGAAEHYPIILGIGMGLSMVLTLGATALSAPLIRRYRLIGWLGIIAIIAVALRLVLQGGGELLHVLA
ncbi:YjbE family putative metal transport protein [Oecophyllibacter saccharovorans]|uniref:YjbE family putative metal transport protein n=1 Tax=Oecophyllibacter saccharovorans TaxID=2558360 RepID=UPI001141F40E|nr:YjbE family putative metal transport protein [Oecophyllibacter saccharovorans]QDH15791.1 TerC family protein [Oecophyllibacter saccharovorans]TPW34631.1 TerC family protein [Oecophyllibacter saccharovorans]